MDLTHNVGHEHTLDLWSLAISHSTGDYFSANEVTLNSQLPSRTYTYSSCHCRGDCEVHAAKECRKRKMQYTSLLNTTGKTTYRIPDHQ